jgi:uncharacterized membrane protein YphA (DoxX/SURF4 family)
MKTESKTFLNALIFLLLRLAVGLLFIFSGAVKMYDPGLFLSKILALHMVPYWVAYAIAHFLPSLEIVAGLLLFTFSFTCASAIVIMLMTILFLIVLSTIHVLGLPADCGCFGEWDFIGGFYAHIAIDAAILIIMSLHLVRSTRLLMLIDEKN